MSAYREPEKRDEQYEQERLERERQLVEFMQKAMMIRENPRNS